MAQAYRLVGSQDPSSRIERWTVESPTEESPEGKVLVLDGEAVELSDEQYAVGSRFLKLEPADLEEEANVEFVDQPGVNMPSQSTDVPPDPGTEPDVERMNNRQLRAEAERVGADTTGKTTNEEIKQAILDKRAEG